MSDARANALADLLAAAQGAETTDEIGLWCLCDSLVFECACPFGRMREALTAIALLDGDDGAIEPLGFLAVTAGEGGAE